MVGVHRTSGALLRLIWGDPPSITNVACAFGSGGPVARDLERLDQVGRFDDESG